MKFDDLSYFFENTETVFEILYKGLCPFKKNDFVVLYHSYNTGLLMIKKLGDSEFNKYQLQVFSTSDMDSIFIKSLQGKDYFCIIREITNDKIRLKAVVVPDIAKQEDDLYIGLSDKVLKDINLSKFDSKIKNEFLFKFGDQEYFIYAQNLNSKENHFAIANKEYLFDILEKKRHECGNCDESISNQVILAITSPEKAYIKENYLFKLKKMNIHFEDYSTAHYMKSQNKIFIQNQLEKYISRWEVFSEAEKEWYYSQIEKAGSISYYDYLNHNNEFQFYIEDTSKMKIFEQVLEEVSGSSKLVTIYTNSNKVFPAIYISSNKNSFKCKFDKPVGVIDNRGQIFISREGFEMQYDRRMRALSDIKSGKSAKTNLAMLLNGTGPDFSKRENIDPISMGVIEVFKNKRPTPNQEKAIKIALNTPDFAIIQGPPGTGKTTVIKAIMKRLQENNDDKRLIYGKDVLTAYQRDATKNLSDNIEILGLPIPYYTGQKEDDVIDANYVKWIDKKAVDISNANPNILVALNKNRKWDAFEKIRISYKQENSTYDMDEYILKQLRSELNNKVDTDFIIKIEKLLEEVEKNLALQKNIFQDEYNIAMNIPTNIISYQDNGYAEVRKIISRINHIEMIMNEIKELKDCFNLSEPDFKKVKELKNSILIKLKPVYKVIIPSDLNNKIYNLMDEIVQSIEKQNLNDEEMILAEYLNAFQESPIQIRSAIDEFLTAIAATHQKSVSKELLEKKEEIFFDNALIDEAARSCPPDLLIPISRAKDRIILVGDHKQLPQLINDKVYDMLDDKKLSNEEKLALKETMFQHLIEQVRKLEKLDGYSRFITLNTQYRMSKPLGDFISRNFYEETYFDENKNEIKTGQIFTDKPISDFFHSLPGIENKFMVWLDVRGNIINSEKQVENSYVRTEEAVVIANHLKKMLDFVENQEFTFGIMSFYRKQVEEIYKELAKIDIAFFETNEYKIKEKYRKKVFLGTVDSFQGLEFDVVYLSMTRSNEDFRTKRSKYGFLMSKQRLCVSLSRQKKCLIIVGNSLMLNGDCAKESVPALVDFYDMCKKGDSYATIIE